MPQEASPKKITVYVNDDIYQEIINLMVAKVRTLSFICNELMAQAIREKERNRRKKEKNPVQ